VIVLISAGRQLTVDMCCQCVLKMGQFCKAFQVTVISCLNSAHISDCSEANSHGKLLSVQKQLEMRLLELIWEQLTHVLLLWRERSATPKNFTCLLVMILFLPFVFTNLSF